MNVESLFVVLQIYGLILIVLSILFFKRQGKMEGQYRWKIFFAAVSLDLLLWIGILLVGGLLFKAERSFLIYIVAAFLLKGLVSSFLKPIRPGYLNYLHFSPPIISGTVLGVIISRR